MLLFVLCWTLFHIEYASTPCVIIVFVGVRNWFKCIEPACQTPKTKSTTIVFEEFNEYEWILREKNVQQQQKEKRTTKTVWLTTVTLEVFVR